MKDFTKIITLFTRKILLLHLLMFVLYFDGISFAKDYEYGRWIVNAFALMGFVRLYLKANKRTKKLMIYAFVIGVIGEQILSIWLDMWTYRLDKMPWYAPLGHAALFARTFDFSKDSVVRKHSKIIVKTFSIAILTYATVFLVFYNDVFGFVMTIAVFLLLIKRPNDRVFFLTMYIAVVGVEIGGTYFECWYWPENAFEVFTFLKSYNPPTGISLFYFLLDVGCFIIYTQIHKNTWKRVLRLRKLKKIH